MLGPAVICATGVRSMVRHHILLYVCALKVEIHSYQCLLSGLTEACLFFQQTLYLYRNTNSSSVCAALLHSLSIATHTRDVKPDVKVWPTWICLGSAY
jgi:hypothetical protein